ncbi:MAG: HAD family hydrolase [Thiolinea sp.]
MILYALDFDGVICDSAVETAITSWNVARSVWPDMPEGDIPPELMQRFQTVRPRVETGYEAPLLVRLLYNGVTTEALLADYKQQLDQLIHSEGLDVTGLKQRFSEIRDQWIECNETEWLQMNPLFDGVADKLRGLDALCYIVTTKQEQFVRHILQHHQIEMAAERIYGLDRQLSKQQVLEVLLNRHPEHQIIFVEDRLPTLRAMEANPALGNIRRQLVDWGYNTPDERVSVQAAGSGIELISLTQFLRS